MNKLYFICLAGFFSVAGCGSDSKEVRGNIQQPQASNNQDKKAEPKLPVGAIVRVPVDANGVEDTSKVELRLDGGAEAATDEASALAAWDSATPASAASSQDELDQNGSTQSWFYWGGYRPWGGYGYGGFGGGYGYGYWPGYNYYGNSYYYGNPYGYFNGGYNYYYYRPWRWW